MVSFLELFRNCSVYVGLVSKEARCGLLSHFSKLQVASGSDVTVSVHHQRSVPRFRIREFQSQYDVTNPRHPPATEETPNIAPMG